MGLPGARGGELVPVLKSFLKPKVAGITRKQKQESSGFSFSRGIVGTALRWRQITGKVRQPVTWVDSDSDVSTPRGSEASPESLPCPCSRRTPVPLSPLSPSCGAYQNEEDFCLHFNYFFPYLCQQEEDLLRQPASEDLRPIEVQGTRRSLVNRIVLIHQRFLTSPLSLYLAVSILDECLKQGTKLRPCLLASISLSIAGKFEEDFEPRVCLKVVNQAMEDEACEDELVAAETQVLQVLNFQLHRPTAEHHRQWLVECVDQHLNLRSDKDRLLRASEYLCEIALLCAPSGRWAPSVTAGCACVVAGVLIDRKCEEEVRALLNSQRRWQQLCCAIRQLFSLLADPEILQCTVYQKYATLEYSYISMKVHEMLEKRLKL